MLLLQRQVRRVTSITLALTTSGINNEHVNFLAVKQFVRNSSGVSLLKKVKRRVIFTNQLGSDNLSGYNRCDNIFFNQNKREFSHKMSAKNLAPTVKLNNGYEMPVLGLGTYELYDQKCVSAVSEAIDLGYRHIDTAAFYRNEKEIGQALKAAFESGRVKREEIFLVTKVWDSDHEPTRLRKSCKKQMEALGLDYIDLYLMHTPGMYSHIDFLETYKVMEKLVDDGWVRSLGISNFSEKQTQRILDNCRIKPVTNQVECHPLLNQLALIEYSKKHDIVITAYSPLVKPQKSQPRKKLYEDKRLTNIAKKYQKTPAQVVLRFLIDIGTVPIPKAAQSQHLKENFDIFDFKLTEDEINILKTLNDGTVIGD